MSKAHSIETLSNEAFGWYLTGLTDGEGCFVLSRRTGRRDGPRSWQIRFDIGMRIDEGIHLEAIARRMRCGKVFRWEAKPPTVLSPKASWGTWRVEELATVIVPHFDRFSLQLKKARDFAIWKKGVACLSHARMGKRHGDPRPISAEADTELAELSAQLKAGRVFDSSAEFILPTLSTSPRSRQRELFPDLE